MPQTVRKIQKKLSSADTAATDIDLFNEPGTPGFGTTNEQDLIKMLRVLNNSASAQVIAVKFNYDDSGYVDGYFKNYSLAAGSDELIVDLIDQTLLGHATTPDKIVIQFDTTLTGVETIEFQGTSIQFS